MVGQIIFFMVCFLGVVSSKLYNDKHKLVKYLFWYFLINAGAKLLIIIRVIAINQHIKLVAPLYQGAYNWVFPVLTAALYTGGFSILAIGLHRVLKYYSK